MTFFLSERIVAGCPVELAYSGKLGGIHAHMMVGTGYINTF